MKFPFFASFIIFIIWLRYELSKHSKSASNQLSSYWQKEAQSNNTRRKSLDSLDYIIIPTRELPMHIMENNEEIQSIAATIDRLCTQKIVNLTGISNTDLKLRYGAPNLPLLMEYDQNYTLLARSLQKWAALLYEGQYPAEAAQVLEFAMSTRTDVTASYTLLARIYQTQHTPERIHELEAIAETLLSASRPTILRNLQELSQESPQP